MTTTGTALRDIAAGLVALDARLDQVAALKPNWDGQGAAPIDMALLRAVRSWGPTMPGWAFAPSPAVVPLSTGTVQLEWRRESRLLELEFETPDRIHFLRYDPPRGIEDEDTMPVADRDRAERLLAWVSNGG
jgi:hypothetical protein